MSATQWSTLDTNEGFDAEAASTAPPARTASRWARGAGIAGVGTALVLLGFAAGRTSTGVSSPAAARVDQATQEEELFKIRKQASSGQCTESGMDCSNSRCCKTTNFYCWQKNSWPRLLQEHLQKWLEVRGA